MRQSVAARFITGVSGAAAVTLVHETARRRVAHAPRMDVVGKRVLKRILHAAGRRAPGPKQLYRAALVGELLSNSAYYSLVGVGHPRRALLRGAVLGAVAGVGGVFLTPKLRLGRQPVMRTPQTAWMTFGWYLLGGLVAGTTLRVLEAKPKRGPRESNESFSGPG